MNSQLLNRSNHGFTLVEIFFVLLIIGILSAIAVPSWLAFLDVNRLNTAQDQVYRAMREAQSKAAQEKLTWQASFRENNSIVQWAVHPATAQAANATWNNLDSHVRLDSETNLQIANGVRQIQFDYQGNVNGQLGRITLSSNNGGKAKRCVIVSTLLGAIRTAKQQSTPDTGGNYCY